MDTECPYCDADVEINHDDGYGYEDGQTFKQQCGNCDKTFVFTTTISFNYETEKADCLNGGEHEWETSHTYPKFFTKMRCTMCDEERNPTTEERIKYDIPLKYEA